MKLTQSQLRKLIKEALQEQYGESFSPEEQAVVDAIEQLVELIYAMGNSNPEMTDYYIMLFRALGSAGVNTSAVSRFA
jgi:hypothetical protein